MMADQDPVERFVLELVALWEKADRPSMRKLSGISGVPATSVHNTLRGHSWPNWQSAKKLIKAMGGDPDAYHDLWAKGESARRQPATGVPLRRREVVPHIQPTSGNDDLATAIRELAQAVRWLARQFTEEE